MKRPLQIMAVILLLAFFAWGAAQEARAQTTTKVDREFYTKGSYSLYLQPWSTFEDPTLIVDKNFKDAATFNATSFPAQTKIAWLWPLAPRQWNKPYGYMALMYGNYAATRAQKPIAPVQIKDLRALSNGYSFTGSAPFGEYNVLAECFLTAQAGGDNAAIKEVGFFPHAPAATLAFAKTGKALGVFTDESGSKWSVYVSDKFVMIFPADGADRLWGWLDFKGVFAFLRAKGELTGDEWFNGLGFGVEPLSGTGSITVSQFQVVQS